MQMHIVARGWLIYSLTSSPLALTWVMLSFMLPSAVFSLFGGVLSDRFKKKPIMVASQILNAGGTLAFGILIFLGDVTFWHFIYFGVFNGTVMALSMPARTSVLPDIVGRKTLVNAMALSSSTFNLARIAGPSAAGMLIAIFAAGDTTSTTGVGLVFFVITFLNIVAVGVTIMLHYQGEPVRVVNRTIRRDFLQGYIFMRRNRVMTGLLIMGLLPMTFGFTPTYLMPVFNVEVVQGDPRTLGFLLTAMGIGALLGSLTLARLGDIANKGRTLFVSAYCWAAAIVMFSFSQHLLVAIVCSALVGLCSSVMGSLNMSVVQLAVPQAMRGRIMAIMWASHGLMPLGMLPIGWLAEFWRIEYALALSAVLLALSMVGLHVFIPELAAIRRGHDEDLESDDSETSVTSETRHAKYSAMS